MNDDEAQTDECHHFLEQWHVVNIWWKQQGGYEDQWFPDRAAIRCECGLEFVTPSVTALSGKVPA